MPSVSFRQEWEDAEEGLTEKVGRVASAFGVSRQAAAVRARSSVVRVISEGQYNDILEYLADEYREFRDSKPTGGGGGMAPPVRLLKELGGKYTRLAFSAYAEGRMSRLEVAEAFDARLGDIEGIRSRL